MGLMLNCNPTIRFNYWPGGNMDKVVDCKADGPGFKTVLNFFLFSHLLCAQMPKGFGPVNSIDFTIE